MIEYFAQPTGLNRPNGFSHAVAATGSLVIVSGQLPLDGDGRLVSTDPLRQAQQVFANLGRALAGADADFAHVVKLGFFLVDLADLDAVRQARDDVFRTDQRPASTLVQVAGLVVPGARMEIEALAVR